MKQVLFGVNGLDALNNGATEYAVLHGSGSWNAAEVDRNEVIATAGTISRLYVELSAAPGGGAGDAYVFTLRKNGAATALTCTITQPATSGSDVAHSVAVVAGDTVSMECVPSSTPSATPTAQFTTLFTGTNANESLMLGRGYANYVSGTLYFGAQGLSAASTDENDARQVCPTAGTIKNLYVSLSADPGTSPDEYSFTLRKNGADTTLHCHIVANDVTGNDTANTVAVVAGDVLTVSSVPVSTPSVGAIRVAFGMTFLASIDGESIILGGLADDLSNADTEYASLVAPLMSETRSTTEANHQQLGQICELRKLYVLLSAAPGAGNDYTFAVLVNGAFPTFGMVVQVAGAATTGNDVTNSVYLANNDNVSLQCVPSSTPGAADAYWGLVCYIPAAWRVMLWS